MQASKAYMTPVVFNSDFIFLIGGYAVDCLKNVNNIFNMKGYELSTIDKYSVKQDKYDLLSISLNMPIYGCVALLASNKKLLICGGFNSQIGPLESVYTINLFDEIRQELAPLKKTGWTAMPHLYKHGALTFFTDSEEGNALPGINTYPLALPLI